MSGEWTWQASTSSTTPAPSSEAVDEEALLDQETGFGPQRSEEEAGLAPLFASLHPGEFLVLGPGEPAQIVSSSHGADPAIFVSKQELIFRDGMHSFRCRVPTTDDPHFAELPLAHKVVAVVVHHPPAGPGPGRYLYGFDAADTIIAKLDDTRTWEFRFDLLEQVCALIDLAYEQKAFERYGDLLAAEPKLAEPHLEFEAHHPAEEEARELSMGVFFGGVLAVGLLGSTGMALVMVNPVGDFYRGLVAAGCVAMGALSRWSASQRRMRRSMRRVISNAGGPSQDTPH